MFKLSIKVIGFSYLLFALAWMLNLNPYPKTNNIRPQLYESPIQISHPRPAFSFMRFYNDYTVTPLFDYELYGLIVSERSDNLLHTLGYHDYANEIDLCVIW